jgi:hypothetical protein
MPLGLNRTDLNVIPPNTSYKNGTPVTLPNNFGNPITEPHQFGNQVTLPKNFGNPVTLPHTFGNIITPPITALNSFAVFPTTANRNSISGTFGMIFTVSQNVTITEFGRLYVAGNVQNHGINLWAVTSQTNLASGTVLAASPSDSNGFKYVTLGTPVTLVPGTSYAIAVDETSGGDTWTNLWVPTLNPIFTDYSSCYSSSGQDTYPNNNGVLDTLEDSPAMVFHT